MCEWININEMSKKIERSMMKVGAGSYHCVHRKRQQHLVIGIASIVLPTLLSDLTWSIPSSSPSNVFPLETSPPSSCHSPVIARDLEVACR